MIKTNKTKVALRETVIFVLSIVISVILTNEPRDYGGDAQRYINMTEGATEAMTWGSRILIPRIIGFLVVGDYSMILHVCNIVIFGTAIYIFTKAFDSRSIILFLICCNATIGLYVGEPLLDASIFLFLAIGAFLVKNNRWLEMNVLFTLSIMLHPIASILLIIMSIDLKKVYYVI